MLHHKYYTQIVHRYGDECGLSNLDFGQNVSNNIHTGKYEKKYMIKNKIHNFEKKLLNELPHMVFHQCAHVYAPTNYKIVEILFHIDHRSEIARNKLRECYIN